MTKNNVTKEVKTSSKLLIAAIVAAFLLGAVLCAVCMMPFISMHLGTHDPVETVDGQRYSMQNPVETDYNTEISYRRLNPYDDELMPLVQEDQNYFYPNTEYQIVWSFPDTMRAEMENGCRDYEVNIEYRFQSSDFAHIWIKVFNPETGRLFVGMTSVLIDGEQCWKHGYGKTSYVCARHQEFDSDQLSFSIYTSALPNAGPKVTDEIISSPSGYVDWHIAGVEEFSH